MNTCHVCKGSGEVERHRGRWIGGGRDGYRRTWFVMATCEACDGTGGPPEPASDTPSETPVTFGVHVIDAPYFTQEKYEQAMVRALVDELRVVTDDTGQAIVCHPGRNGGYAVSKTRCDCPAGIHGQPCKHRAIYCFHMQVRLPQVRK